MKISVIIPVYNSEKYIERCLKSVVNQSYKDLEIILIDDGSTDNSSLICKKWEKLDNRVKYFRKENGGPSTARNYGLKHVSGDYIHFLDSDDWIDLETYSHCYKLIKNNKYPDIVKFSYITVHGQKNIIQKKECIKKWDRTTMLKYFFRINGEDSNYCIWDKLINARILENFNFVDTMFEDVEASFDIYCRSKGLIETNKIFYFYYKNNTSITNSPVTVKDLDYLKVWDRIVERTKKEHLEFLKYADFCYKRASFTLLAKMMIKGYDKNDNKLKDNKIELKKLVGKNFISLFFGKMPISRKILLIFVMLLK